MRIPAITLSPVAAPPSTCGPQAASARVSSALVTRDIGVIPLQLLRLASSRGYALLPPIPDIMYTLECRYRDKPQYDQGESGQTR